MTDNQFERLVLALERIASVLEGPRRPKSLWDSFSPEERAAVSLDTQARVASQDQFYPRKSTT